MSVIKSIDTARQRGASDEQILNTIKQQNPEKKKIFDEAVKRGATPDIILREIVSQNQKSDRGIFKKGGKLDKITSFGGKVSDFLFGSSSKTIGSLLGSGYESARDLAGKPVKDRVFTDEKGTPKYLQETSGGEKAVDIAFTALELSPGGGQLTKLLKKIPGGEFIAKNIADKLKNVPSSMKAKALEQYTSIFRAGTKETKGLVKKVAPELLQSKKIIKSPEKLKEEASEKLLSIGSKIDKQLKSIPKGTKIEIGGAVKKLDDLRSKYVIGKEVINKTKVDAIDKTKDIVLKLGNKVEFNDVRKLRQILDESISEAKGFTADTATKFSAKVDKILADTIRNEISKTSPNLAKLNSQYSLWSNVKKLSGYTVEKAKGQVLKRTSGGVLGGIVGATQGEGIGGKITGATIGALLGEKVIKYMNSPAWKSVSAITKNKIADNIAKGNFKAAQEIIKRSMIVLKNKMD